MCLKQLHDKQSTRIEDIRALTFKLLKWLKTYFRHQNTKKKNKKSYIKAVKFKKISNQAIVKCHLWHSTVAPVL